MKEEEGRGEGGGAEEYLRWEKNGIACWGQRRTGSLYQTVRAAGPGRNLTMADRMESAERVQQGLRS